MGQQPSLGEPVIGPGRGTARETGSVRRTPRGRLSPAAGFGDGILLPECWQAKERYSTMEFGHMSSRLGHFSALCVAIVFFLPSLRAINTVPVWSYWIAIAGLATASIYLLLSRGVRRWEVDVAAFVLLCAGLFAWLLFSVLWTRSTTQYEEDIGRIAALIALVSSAAIVITPQVARRALTLLVLGSLVLTGYVIRSYAASGTLSGYDVEIAQYYLIISSAIATGAVGSAIQATITHGRPWPWLLSALVLLAGLSLSLGRGSLLFAIAVIVLFGGGSVLSDKGRRRRLNHLLRNAVYRGTLIVLLVGAVVGAIWSALRVERTATRLQRLISGAEWEAGGRGHLWTTAWSNIQEAFFFGYGLGSSGIMSAGVEENYPHNLILQVWLDGGLPAVGLLCGIIVLPYLAAIRANARAGGWRHMYLPWLGIYTQLVLEYSKSTNLYSGRTLFLAGIITVRLASAAEKCEARFPQGLGKAGKGWGG